MPVYNASAVSQDKPVLMAGSPVVVLNVDDPIADGYKSRQICLHRTEHLSTALSVELAFSGDPGTFQIDLQTADTDEEKYYVTKSSLKSTDSLLNSSFVGRIETPSVVAKFARLMVVDLTNAVTVVAKFF